MQPHEEAHSTIAYYRQPATDGSRPGQYWINTAEPTTRPRYEAEVLAYHESVPGHHLQIAIAQELEGLPAFRRNLGSMAYVEGWGLYTERLADEMGLYSGDLDRIGVLSFDAWRASRLVVDTGMHAMGWPRDQAVRVHARAHGPRPQQHRERGRPVHRLAGPGPRLQARPARAAPPPARRRRRGSAPPSTSARSTTPCWADGALPLPTLRACRRSLVGDSHRPGLSDAGGTTAIRTAAGTLATVLRNRDIRSMELAWTLGIAADWAVLVVALLVAYDVGGAALVGVVSLVRMVPATLINLFLDTGRFARAERVLVWVNLVRSLAASAVAFAILVDVPVLVFVALALGSGAAALVRPTMMAILPAVARTPDELVSANVDQRARRGDGHASSGRSRPASPSPAPGPRPRPAWRRRSA